MCLPKDYVFFLVWPLRSENGYRLCLFWSEMRYDFGGNYGGVKEVYNVFVVSIPNE